MKSRITYILFSFGLLLLVTACSRYYQKITTFHQLLQEGKYSEAQRNLEKIKFLQRKKNTLLFCLEMGKVAHLNKQYDTSNYYLNIADALMDERNNVANFLVGVTVNPSETPYRAEDFEKVLIHYYKSLNYSYLGKTEDATVEARRITLRMNDLASKYKEKGSKYSRDGFALIVQGILYEKDKDYNNAFISYRNAYESFEKDSVGFYMGAQMPEQLKKDLLRSAAIAGFPNEVEYYERKFNTKYVKSDVKKELVFFWENGVVPIKEEKDFLFTLNKNSQTGAFYFTDESGAFSFPFVYSFKSKEEETKFSNLGIIRVAFPKYIEQPNYYNGAKLMVNSTEQKPFELAENVNALAFKTLRDRYLKEMGLALTRLAIKKVAEAAVSSENEGLGAIVGLANAITEKADTRNWQTLPHSIYYTRVPVNDGQNNVSLILSTNFDKKDTVNFKLDAREKISFINYASLKNNGVYRVPAL